MSRNFTAKFPGICAKCDGRINTGDAITWARRGAKGIYHASCSQPDLIDQMVNEPELQVVSNGHAPVNVDALAGFAALLQPYIKASHDSLSDSMSERIDEAIKDAMANVLESIAPQRIEVYNHQTQELKTVPSQHELFPVLLSLVASRQHVYMYGGPGSGKSTAGFAVADALGMPHGYIALTAQTSESRLFGYMDATGNYVKTRFYECYVDGGVFVIDEADNASANLLTALNGALANGTGAFPCGNMPRHRDFVCLATGNTSGWGANPMFPERRPMDAAFRERFLFLSWEYDQKFERLLALAENPNAGDWVDWVQYARSFAKTTYPKLMVTPRASIQGARLMAAGMAYAQLADMLVFKGFDADSSKRILSSCPLPKGGR